ncbi:hypothetical protein Cme02nite_37060 [Catellatospora methionotrophica]|uniref:Uncharacterized protein n=1 Tax=Catellatospora methionotrophica TaxID=121620 RepID=A0A8J3LBL6_9ACTN|nr:hypothetical protein [Catellatospora methionotrophica]GIG15374.1 hypothetical protein Cme02nite_37060 [Catellatospora methionotrophica]
MTVAQLALGGALAGAYVLLLALRRRAAQRQSPPPARAFIRTAARPVRVLRTGLRRHTDRVPRRLRRRLPKRPANRNALV